MTVKHTVYVEGVEESELSAHDCECAKAIAYAFSARGISSYRFRKSCQYKGAQIDLMIAASDTMPAKRKIAELVGEVENRICVMYASLCWLSSPPQ